MKTLQNSSHFTLEVKQSKFIAHLIPYRDFTSTLTLLKAEHPKARHFVTAYRYLNEFQQIVEHSSDDGEPKGTSGKPSLMVLQGADLVNVAVIVVRYFGGTKLGTGGLVRAYSDAVNASLGEARLIEYRELQLLSFEAEYSDVRLIDYEITACEIETLEKRFESKAIYRVQAPKEALLGFIKRLERVIKLF